MPCARTSHGSRTSGRRNWKNREGPFLFGAFSIADAMYAPVVSRFQTYRLSDADVTARYTATMTALPAWQEWEAAGRDEPWTVPADEI